MRPREAIGRFALVLVGLVGAALIVEAVLQLGARIVRVPGADPIAALGGGRRILCLGDSNTYGIRVERHQSYPEQLEALWSERLSRTGEAVEVVNLGYPGTNSSRLASQFRELIESFEPDVAIVMIGVNDFWTRPVAVDYDAARPATGDERVPFVERSRLARLIALLWARLGSTRELEVDTVERGWEGGTMIARYGEREFEFGFELGRGGETDREVVRVLQRNLRLLVQVASRFDTELVLMTYPSKHYWYTTASSRLRFVARTSGTRLVDLERIFEPHCPEGVCPQLVFVGNQHPTAAGYRLIAETLLAEIGPAGG